MYMNLLSADEVEYLTDYKRPSDQARYCRKHGIRHFISGKGRVKVPVSALNEAVSIETTEPDFGYLYAAIAQK